MTGWQITATTVYCPALQREVTLMVYKDWRVKCTGYEESGGVVWTNGHRRKSITMCEGIDCVRITAYKNKLLSEEAANAGSPDPLQS